MQCWDENKNMLLKNFLYKLIPTIPLYHILINAEITLYHIKANVPLYHIRMIFRKTWRNISLGYTYFFKKLSFHILGKIVYLLLALWPGEQYLQDTWQYNRTQRVLFSCFTYIFQVDRFCDVTFSELKLVPSKVWD